MFFFFPKLYLAYQIYCLFLLSIFVFKTYVSSLLQKIYICHLCCSKKNINHLHNQQSIPLLPPKQSKSSQFCNPSSTTNSKILLILKNILLHILSSQVVCNFFKQFVSSHNCHPAMIQVDHLFKSSKILSKFYALPSTSTHEFLDVSAFNMYKLRLICPTIWFKRN